MTPLPTSGMSEWKAQMRYRPSLSMLRFATLGFRNPDAIPAFHRFEFIRSAKRSFDVRFLCDNNGISAVNFGLAVFQISLLQLTDSNDFVVGKGRILKGRGDIMPVRFKGGLQHTSEQLLEQTMNTMELSRWYLHEPVKNLLSELSISRQTLLRQVTFDWIANAYATIQTTDMYFEHAHDLILVVCEDWGRNLVVFVGLDGKTYDKEHGKVMVYMYVRAMEQLVAQGTSGTSEMGLVDAAERQLSMERGGGLVLEVPFTSILHKLQEVVAATPHEGAVKDRRGYTTIYSSFHVERLPCRQT